MRAVLLVAALLVACGPKEDADDLAMDSTPVTPPAVTAADLAGTWNWEVRPMTSDSVVSTGQTVFNADGMSLTQMATGASESTQGTVTLSGDQINTSTGPYSSYLRPGVMVTTTGTYRLEDGRLVGTVTARYAGVTTADSVVELRSTMTRVP